MRVLSIVLAVLLCKGVAIAAPSSEFFHQAKPGGFEYTANLNTEYAMARFANNAESEVSEAVLGFQLERGFFETLSAGLWLGYGFAEATRFGIDEDSSGIEDIKIYLKGYRPTHSGSFRYGLSFSVSLEDREINTDGSSNRSTGGHWAQFYLGYEHNDGPYSLGFRLSQDLSIDDRIEKSELGGSIEVTGSEDFQVAFYIEKPKNDSGYWGGEFSYSLTSDREANGAKTDSMSPVFRFGVYRPTPLASTVIIPKLSLGLGTADRVYGAELDEYTELRLSAALRF